jgi:hypothetical protein
LSSLSPLPTAPNINPGPVGENGDNEKALGIVEIVLDHKKTMHNVALRGGTLNPDICEQDALPSK